MRNALSVNKPPEDRASYQRRINIVRDRRTSMDAASGDLEFAMLLVIVTRLESEIEALRGKQGGPQTRLGLG